jgi:hypothetical protein
VQTVLLQTHQQLQAETRGQQHTQKTLQRQAEQRTAQPVNDQGQLVRQRIYYASLANFWSSVFLGVGGGEGSHGGRDGGSNTVRHAPEDQTASTAAPGSVLQTSSTGVGVGGELHPPVGPPSSSSSSPSALSFSADSSPVSSRVSSFSSSSSSSSPSSFSSLSHAAPSAALVVGTVALVVLVAMLIQYCLRRTEAAMSDDMALQYRSAVHSLYQQIVAVTLLCAGGFSLASAAVVHQWSSPGGGGGSGGGGAYDLWLLLVDVNTCLALTAVVFLCCGLTMVGCGYAASRRWRYWESEARYPDNLVWRFAMSLLKRRGIMDTNVRWYECDARRLVDHDAQALGFLLLRTEFVPFVLRPPAVHYRNNRYWYFPRKRDCSAMDFQHAHLDFEQYLSHQSGRLLVRLLQVPLATWLLLELLILVVCLTTSAPPGVQLVVLVVFEYLLLAAAALAWNYHRNSYSARVQHSRAWRELEARVLAKSAATGEWRWNEDHKQEDDRVRLISDLMEIMMRCSGGDLGRGHELGAGRSLGDRHGDSDTGSARSHRRGGPSDQGGESPGGATQKTSKGRVATARAASVAFCKTLGSVLARSVDFRSHGGSDSSSATTSGNVNPQSQCKFYPAASLSVVRLLLLMLAVLASVVVAALSSFVAVEPHSASTIAAGVAAAVLAAAPLPVVLWLLVQAMHYSSLLSSTGEFRDEAVVADVVASGKARMTRAALRVLDALILHSCALEARGERDQRRRPLQQQQHRGGLRDERGHAERRVGGAAAAAAMLHAAAEPWKLTFERLVESPSVGRRGNAGAAAAAADDDYDDNDDGGVGNSGVSGVDDDNDDPEVGGNEGGRRHGGRVGVVTWPAFLAWYRRWMCRSDVPIGADVVWATFFADADGSQHQHRHQQQHQQQQHHHHHHRDDDRGIGIAEGAELVVAGCDSRDSYSQASLSREEFQQVFERRCAVEHALTSSCQEVEDSLRQLFDVSEVAPGSSSAEPCVSKASFVDGTLHVLDWGGAGSAGAGAGGGGGGSKATASPSLGAPVPSSPSSPSAQQTSAQVAARRELAAFFDEVDPTLEGFATVASLARVLHRYWFWPGDC